MTRSMIFQRRVLALLVGFFFLQGTCVLAQQASNSDAKASVPPASQPIPPPVESKTQATQDQTPRPSLPPAIDPKTMTPLYETIQEDWGSLEIGTSKLEPEQPLVGSTDEQDTYVRQLVQVKWRPGDALDLWVVLPKGVKKPPVVLYLYDTGWDTDRFKDTGWCKRATGGGVAAVGFVSALSGHRFHDRPLKQTFVSELQESLGSTVHDVKFILDYLDQRGDVDMNRVGMFGEGSGGAIAILAAAADERIKAVDALDPWGDWPDFLAKSPLVQDEPGHEQYVKPEFLKKVAGLDPVKWLPAMKTPIRIQQVRQNSATPIECKERIKEAAPKQAEILRFEAVSDLGQSEGQGRLFDWIKDRVQEAGKPGSAAASPAVANRESKQ